jgi:hypothetical protein
MHRRTFIRLLSAAAVSQPLCLLAVSRGAPHAARFRLTRADELLLDEIERRACLFFFEQASPNTGQVLDRAKWVGSTGALDSRRMASIAATGFGLSALCIAHHRNYQPRARILDQVRRTLRFHANTLPHDHGFFTHFNDIETGAPWRHSEVSSIDTGLLLCGVLTARAYFHTDPEIVRLATEIYNRVEWPWMLDGGKTFSMGLRDGKFIKSRWDHYCELMLIYLLAIASPTHPIDPACWDAFTRPTMEFGGYKYISSSDPLFVHQYSHAWFDFRNKRDRYANYFDNSVTATRAHLAFCLSLGEPYSADYWGISASDSQHGYVAWGGPPRLDHPDGSVVPYATAGSLPFLPADCLRVQRALQQFGDLAWGRYGYADVFKPSDKWYDSDVLGIDLGITVLMAENLRSGFVWQTFSRNPEVAVAFRRAGFHPERA